jgi:capsular polysaccharide biosynthesis protein
LDKELTLRDYGRVLRSGRWIILTTTVAAALVALILSLARTTHYTATSHVFLGQVTTISGTPIQTADTSPATASEALGGDDVIARVAAKTGVAFKKIKDNVDFSVPRTPGGQAANQPAVATITYSDTNRPRASRVANAYADEVLAAAQGKVDAVQSVLVKRVAQRQQELALTNGQVDSARKGLRTAGSDAAQQMWQALLFAATQSQSQIRTDLSNTDLELAKSRQAESPRLLSRSEDTTSSAGLTSRLRTVIFGAIIGFILGIVITFVWRGSPAGRAAE